MIYLLNAWDGGMAYAINQYKNAIWTFKQREIDTFQFIAPASIDLLKNIAPGMLCCRSDDYGKTEFDEDDEPYLVSHPERYFIIEKIELNTEQGKDEIIVTGYGLKRALQLNFIKSTVVSNTRYIGNIMRDMYTASELNGKCFINSNTYYHDTVIKSQWTWDNLFKAYTELADLYNSVLYVALQPSTGVLLPGLSKRRDLSSSILFSDDNGIQNMTYIASIENYRSSVYIAGAVKPDSLGGGRFGTFGKRINYYKTPDGRNVFISAPEMTLDPQGIACRSEFIDARDLQPASMSSTDINNYMDMLQERLSLKLEETAVQQQIEFTLSENCKYEYGVDFRLGDTIKLETKYGINRKGIIDEVTIMETEGGKVTVTPSIL